MDLSIVIVNWNTRELLSNCLTSIRGHRSELKIETIVVDNNSSDGSRAWVSKEFPEVKLFNAGANLGFGRGCNVGVRHASSDLVLFLNPDTEVRADTLRRMTAFMHANTSVGGLGCRIRDADGSTKPLGLQCFPSPWTELRKFFLGSPHLHRRWPRFFNYRSAETSEYVEKLFGACLMARKRVLKEVGLFDERFFMYCEDVDLCYRITRAGWKLYYMSEAEIYHLGGGASAKAPGTFAVLMGCESFEKFMRKHHGRVGAYAYRAVCIVGPLFRLMLIPPAWVACKISLVGRLPDVRGSASKQVKIIGWALGALRPVVLDAPPGSEHSIALPTLTNETE